MKYRLTALLFAGMILLLCSGCQNSDLGEPPAKMKTVTQNSTGDNATFSFEIPEDWMTGMSDALSVGAFPEAMNGNREIKGVDALPYVVSIDQCYYHNHSMTQEEKETMRQDLFEGKTTSFEMYLRSQAEMAAQYVNASPPEYTDFTCRHYSGKNGKITGVRYSEVYEDTTIDVIYCYREDIPYVVIGVFSDEVELSSGDIAPWVASSLNVTEHYLSSEER